MWLERVAPLESAITPDRAHPRRRMPLERAAALLLLVCLSGLLALALAGPPDPSWLPGIYDDADADNVVALLCDSSAVALRLTTLVECGHPRLGRASARSVSPSADPSLLGSHPRSPPGAAAASR